MIPILDGQYAFAQIGLGGDVGFFDLISSDNVTIGQFNSVPIAFRIPVAKEARTKGHWKLLGNAPLIGELGAHANYRHQPVGSSETFLYSNGVSRSAPAELTSQLETLATWFWMHVKSRLEDHFRGQTNRFVKDVGRIR